MNITRPNSNQPIPENAKKVFAGKVFNVYQWEQKLFDGAKAVFEKIKRTDTVNVLPVTDEGKIILSKQEQPGMAPFVGVIGGRVDEGEEPLEAAKRELLEETGLTAQGWGLWDAIQLTEKIDWAIYTFVARGCSQSREVELEAGEKISLIEVTWEELINFAAQPNFRDVEVILKLYRVLNNPVELEKAKKLFTA